MAGFSVSHHTGRARFIADSIAKAYPDQYETWYYFDTKGFKKNFLESIKNEIKESGGILPEDHATSPFCWLETTKESKKEMVGLGGRDKLCEWTKSKFDATEGKNAAFLPYCDAPPVKWKTVIFDFKTPGTAQVSPV